MDSFRDMIGLWPHRRDFAADCDVAVGLVQQWERRNSIPARHWNGIVAAARRRGIEGVTLQALALLAERRAAA